MALPHSVGCTLLLSRRDFLRFAACFRALSINCPPQEESHEPSSVNAVGSTSSTSLEPAVAASISSSEKASVSGEDEGADSLESLATDSSVSGSLATDSSVSFC